MIKILLLLATLASAQQRVEVVNPSPAEPLFVTTVSSDGTPSGLATEATLAAISTTAVATKARVDLLATEATNASISTTNTAILARANLLATEAISLLISASAAGINANTVGLSTTTTAILARANLLATESTLAGIKSQIDQLQFLGGDLQTGVSSGTATVGVTNGSLNVNVVSANLQQSAANTGVLSAATGGADNPMLLVVNPSTSPFSMSLLNRAYGISTTNRAVNFGMWLDPTVTSSGTPTSVSKIGSSTYTVVQAFTSPTISANGSAIDYMSTGQNTAAIVITDTKSVIVTPGHKILFTANPSANATGVTISVKWSEP